MANTEVFFKKLIERFPDLEPVSRVARERRIFTSTPSEKFLEVVSFIHDDLGFAHISTITGLDEGEFFAPMYHFARRDGDGTLINLRVLTPRDQPRLPTITHLYKFAEYYERELVDLFGIEITGLAPGHRYPLPDNWPKGQYPLRKDWNVSMLNDEAPKKSSQEGGV
jgi:NADH:ubiquinone oxidoreductase subunit C